MISIKINGATCQGCVQSIEKAIGQVTGVDSVKFDLDSKLAKIDGDASLELIGEVIEQAGFDVVESSSGL